MADMKEKKQIGPWVLLVHFSIKNILLHKIMIKWNFHENHEKIREIFQNIIFSNISIKSSKQSDVSGIEVCQVKILKTQIFRY